MSLLEILLGVGLVAGITVSGLVYLDCTRRGMPPASRLVRALVCGAGSFGGFLLPYAFSRELAYLYFQVLKSRPVAVAPREWLAVNLATGFVFGIAVVGGYVARRRAEGRRPPGASDARV